MIIPILALFASSMFAAANEQVFDVRNFGAKPDGQTLCTTNIQHAINVCAASGGGVVDLPGGSYVSGTLTLRSHVELRIEKSAILLGSTNLEDYPPAAAKMRHLIGGENLDTVIISGSGMIDGRGARASFPGEMAITNRPYNICLQHCTNVTVRNITLRNSAFWMQRYIECNQIRISKITVWNHNNYNNDGLDLDDCHDAVVDDCQFDSDDDAICLKSSSRRGCENILVTNCVASSHANPIKFGTASVGGFKHIKILNCQIKPSVMRTKIYGNPSGLSGVALEIVDGGVMEDVLVSGIEISGTRAPIFVRLGERSQHHSSEPGALRQVTIENVNARGVGDLGCVIAGIEGHPIENLTLRNITIESKGGGLLADAQRKLEPRDSAYPECTMFGQRLPAFGFYFWNVRGLKIEHITLRSKQADARPPIAFEQVDAVRLNGKPVGLMEMNLPDSRRLVLNQTDLLR